VLLFEGWPVTLGIRFQFLAAASISTGYAEDGGSVSLRNAEGHLSDCTTSIPSDDNMHSVRPCFTPVCFTKFFFSAACLFIPLNLRSFVFRLTPFGGFLAFIKSFCIKG
jgi:hypothetical protein